MRVLFLEPLRSYVKEPGMARFSLAYPQLAAVLRQDDVDVSILDPHADCLDWGGLKEEIQRRNPDVVAIGCNATMNAYRAMESFDFIKEINPEIVTVGGGVYLSLVPEESMKMCGSLDFIVAGEGEYTLRELVRELRKDKPSFRNVKGLVFREGDALVRTPPRPEIENLDTLPFPAYELAPVGKMESYFGVKSHRKGNTDYMMMITSRGCSWHCTFCTQWKLYGTKWRAFSAKRVADEIEFLNGTYNKTTFVFGDNNFNQDRQRVADLADEIIRRDIHIKYSVTTRIDLLLRDRDILEKMVDSGLLQVTLGMDAVATDEALRDVRKGLTLKQIKECSKMLREEYPEIIAQWFVVFGNRKDTKESMKATVQFLLDEVRPDLVNFFIVMPHPGTDLWKTAKEQGWIEVADYSKYDENHAIMPTETLSRKELTAAVRECTKEFYSSPQFLEKLNSKYGFKRQFIRMYSKKIFSDIAALEIAKLR